MKRIIASVLLVITTTADLGAHDTFLKFESHYLQPQSQVTVALMNGTIDVSESSVAVDRMRDVRIVGPGQLSEQQDNNQWALTEKLSTLGFMTGGPWDLRRRRVNQTPESRNVCNRLRQISQAQWCSRRPQGTAKEKIVTKCC